MYVFKVGDTEHSINVSHVKTMQMQTSFLEEDMGTLEIVFNGKCSPVIVTSTQCHIQKIMTEINYIKRSMKL